MKKTSMILSAIAAAAFAITPAFAHEGEDHKGETKSITGEVVDMACYVDHGATGEKHADCAKKCISMGLPVGIKSTDGTTYLIIADHKPMNKELAEYAAKTITVKGKVTERDGIHLIENAEIEKK
jgi:hypothetical protein